MNKKIYVIKTESKLLAEFAQSSEGMGKIILAITIPFWGISWLVRKIME